MPNAVCGLDFGFRACRAVDRTSPAGGVCATGRVRVMRAQPRNNCTKEIKQVETFHRNDTRDLCITPPTLYVLNVRRCDRCTRKPLRTRNTSSPLPGRCFLPHGARGHLCISGSTHALAPTPPFVSLTTVGFFRLPFRSRAPTKVRLPPLRPRALCRHVTAQS